MLQGEYGGRHQHCRLLAVNRSLECRPDSYLRLSETYIAANQAVHGAHTFHVALDRPGRHFLVGSIFIHERRFEFLLQVGIGGKGIGLGRFSACVKLYEILRYVFYP